MECRRLAAHLEALKRMCSDPPARRAQLWLRALEKEDRVSIDMLRKSDALVELHVRAFIERERTHAPIDARRNDRALYGWLQDRYFAEYAGLDQITCICPHCVSDAQRDAQVDDDEDDGP